MKKFMSVLSVMAVMAGSLSAQNVEVESITEDKITEEADLTQIAYDFKIHPLKANGKIDGIGGIKSWGDVMLARNSNSSKILRFDNYRLTGVVDKLGIGENDYYFIEDFSYDAVNNAIYIENDSNLVTFDAKTFEFRCKQPVNLMIQNILNLGDKMLYYGYYKDEYERQRIEDKVYLPKEKMILVDRDERDLKKGTVLYMESGLQRSLLGYPELFFVNPKNRSTCLTGFVNTIVTFDDEKVTDVYRFKLGDADVPASIDKIFEKEEFTPDEVSRALSIVSNQMSSAPTSTNTYNIMVDGKTVSFRVTYRGELGTPSRYLYFVHDDKGTKVYKHLRIPGIKQDIDPTGCNGNHQIAIIENVKNVIDEDADMSPLAKQIIDELKKQDNGNPVLIEFRFK